MGQRYSLAEKSLEGSGLKGGGIDDNTSLTKIRPTADCCEGPSLSGRSCPDLRLIHKDDHIKEHSSSRALQKIDYTSEKSRVRSCDYEATDGDCKPGLTGKEKDRSIIRSKTFDEGKKIPITSEISKSVTSLNTDNKLLNSVDDKINIPITKNDSKMTTSQTVILENTGSSDNTSASLNSDDAKTVDSKCRKFKCILDSKTLPKCNNASAMTKAQKMISKSKENLFCHETSNSKMKQKDSGDTMNKSKSTSNIMLGSVNENHFRAALSRLWQRKSTDKTKKKCDDDDWDDLDESNSQTFLRDASLRSVSFSRKTIFNTMKSKTLKARCSVQRYYNSEEQKEGCLTSKKDSPGNKISDQNDEVLISPDDGVIRTGNSSKEGNMGRNASNPRTVRGNGTPHAVRVLKATLRLVDIDDDTDDDQSFISVPSDSKEMFSSCKDSNKQQSDVIKPEIFHSRKDGSIQNHSKIDSILSKCHTEEHYSGCTCEDTVTCNSGSGSTNNFNLESTNSNNQKEEKTSDLLKLAIFQEEIRPRPDHIGLVRGRRVDQRKRFVSPERSIASSQAMSDASISSNMKQGGQFPCYSYNNSNEEARSAMKALKLESQGFSQNISSLSFNKTGFSSYGSDCEPLSNNSVDQISNRNYVTVSKEDINWPLHVVRTSSNYSDKNKTKIHRYQSDAILKDFYNKEKLWVDKKNLLKRAKSLHCHVKVSETRNCHTIRKLEHSSACILANGHLQTNKDSQNSFSTCTTNTESEDCMGLRDRIESTELVPRLENNLTAREISESMPIDSFDYNQEEFKKFQPKQSVDSDDSVFVHACTEVNTKFHTKYKYLDHNTEECNNIINRGSSDNKTRTEININLLNNDRPTFMEEKNGLKSYMLTSEHKPHSSTDTNEDTSSSALTTVNTLSEEKVELLKIDESDGVSTKFGINRDSKSSDRTENHLLSIPLVQSCSCSAREMTGSMVKRLETQVDKAEMTDIKMANKDSNNKPSLCEIPAPASGAIPRLESASGPSPASTYGPTPSLGSADGPSPASIYGPTPSLGSAGGPSPASIYGPTPGLESAGGPIHEFKRDSSHAHNVICNPEDNPGSCNPLIPEASSRKSSSDTDYTEPDSGVCERSCNPAAIKLILENLLQRELNRRAAADSTPANSPTSASSAPAAYPLAAASPTAFYQAANLSIATHSSASTNTASINATNSTSGLSTTTDYCTHTISLMSPPHITTRRSISVVKNSNSASLGNININLARRSDRWGQAARSLADVVRMGVSAVHERSPTSSQDSDVIFGKLNQKSDMKQNRISQDDCRIKTNYSEVTCKSNEQLNASTMIISKSVTDQSSSLNSVSNTSKEIASQVSDFDKLDVDRAVNEYNRYDSGVGTSEKSGGISNTTIVDTNAFSSVNSYSQNSEPTSQFDSTNKTSDTSSINSENYNHKETAWKYSPSLSSSFASSSTSSVKPVAMVYPRKIHGVRVLPPAPPSGRPSGNRASVIKPRISNRDNTYSMSPFGNAYSVPTLKSASPRSSIMKTGRKSEKTRPREGHVNSDPDQTVSNRFFAALKNRNVSKKEIKESDEIISRVTDRVERLERAQREARMLKLRNDLSDARHRKYTHNDRQMSAELNSHSENVSATGCIESISEKIAIENQNAHDPKSENSVTDHNDQAEKESNQGRSDNYLVRPRDVKNTVNGKREKGLSVLSITSTNLALHSNRPKHGNAAPQGLHKLSESSAMVEFGVVPGNGANKRNENNLNIYRKQNSEEVKSNSIDDDDDHWISKAQEKDLLEGHEGLLTGPLTGLKVVDVDQSGLYVEGKKEAEFEALVQTVRGNGKFRGVRKGLELIKKVDPSHKGVVDFEETLGYFP